MSFIIGVLVAVWAFSIAFLISDAVHVDNANRNFANRCHAIGGSAIIENKDLCIVKGRIVFREK